MVRRGPAAPARREWGQVLPWDGMLGAAQVSPTGVPGNRDDGGSQAWDRASPTGLRHELLPHGAEVREGDTDPCSRTGAIGHTPENTRPTTPHGAQTLAPGI